MRNYELMTITKSSLTDERAKQVSKDVQELISSLKGSVTKTDYWGKRKLAYEIAGFKEGYYDIIHFECDPAQIAKLKSKIELMDNVIRYLVSLIPVSGVSTRKAKTKTVEA